jgi:hypothetical protein
VCPSERHDEAHSRARLAQNGGGENGMSYSYQKERPSLFTEDGVKLLTKIRDRANYLVKEAGAFTAENAWSGCAGSVWQFAACLDYMAEQGEIVCLSSANTWGQYRVFAAAQYQATEKKGTQP